MPTSPSGVVVGDPVEVAAAARALSSIAAAVQTQAVALRAVASAHGSWSGAAALQARARSATLPPKLDKTTASYSAAGSALLGYARALADAQARSAAAVSSAARAADDLGAARAAQAAASQVEAQAAAAATASGITPPPPTADRYQASIDDAARRLAQAQAANDAAHEQQRQAATRAAAALRVASHEGIRNRSWWQHITHAAAHWAAASWRASLARLSKAAGTISTLATVAALVLAASGALFPPLEAAAALCESVALVSGVVAGASDAILGLSDRRTRAAGAIAAAEILLPGAAKRVVRELPIGAGRRLLTTADGEAQPGTVAEPRSIPLGFASHEEFQHFGATLRAALDDAGYCNTVGIMQGSAVTGFKYTTGDAFDTTHRSDFDIALTGPDIVAAADDAGIPFRGQGSRTAPLSKDDLRQLGLTHARDALKQVAKRPVAFMIFRDEQHALNHRPSIRIP